MVKSLTKKQVEHIQYNESVIFLDYGESTERYLAPTRGGGEFNATATIRDIEFDGRQGKTKGAELIEEQDAVIKVTTLCMSPENLKLAIPSTKIEKDGEDQHEYIENPENGLIPDEAYLKNITQFCKLLNGQYVKITVFNPLSENGLTVKAQPKAEGELALEVHGHYPLEDLNKKGGLWRVDYLKTNPNLDFTKDGLQTIALSAAAPVIKIPVSEAESGTDKSALSPV